MRVLNPIEICGRVTNWLVTCGLARGCLLHQSNKNQQSQMHNSLTVSLLSGQGTHHLGQCTSAASCGADIINLKSGS